MKVLQVNSVCGYGSTGNIAVDLYRELKAQGHEGCIAYGRGTAPSDVESYRIGTNLDVYMHGALSRLTDRHGFYSTKATKNFVKWMKEYNPDIIHLHNLHGYYINVEILFKALKEMGKPVIWTLHDCWSFTGHCSYFTYVGCEKWKTQCKCCPQRRAYPASLLKDNSYRNYVRKRKIFTSLDADKLTIATPSKWLEGLVKESFLSKYSVQCIYNGIDLETFEPTLGDFRVKNGLNDKKIILGVANVWNETKGIETFNTLAEQLDSKEYAIVIVGTDEKSRTYFDKRILCINRTKNKQELAEIYTTADLFLNPSFQETMGLTTVEALACGTDVLVRNATALPEIVQYDKARVMDDNNWINQVIELANNSSKRAENRELAMQYEKKQQYRKYVDLYCEMVNKA